MAKKKINLSSDKLKELEGFEDVVDLVFGEGSSVSQVAREKNIEGYEVYSFLDRENQRLEAVDRFFTTKLKTMEFYSQSETLVKKQKAHRDSLLDFLSRRMASPDSLINKRIAQLYDQAFGKK
jgi:predicted methyltransferase